MVIFVTLGASSVAFADARSEARRFFRQGMERVENGYTDEGVALLIRAYEVLPHPNVLYNIGRAYAEAGQFENAIDYFGRYLAANPPDAGETRALILRLENELERIQTAEAARLAEEAAAAVETAPEPEVTAAATDTELAALEEAARQIQTLADATQSEPLRARTEELRGLRASLSERQVIVQPDEVAGAGETEGETETETETEGETEGETETEGESGSEGESEGESETEPDADLAERLGFDGAEGGEDDFYEERVISAGRFPQSPLEAAVSTHIVTRQDIRLSGLTSIPEILRRVAGLDVMTVSPNDTNIGIRGFNERLATKVIIMIDGRATTQDAFGATIWDTLPIGVEDIERIEVVRGPASAIYGANAFSGVINIVTRPAGEQSGSGRRGRYARLVPRPRLHLRIERTLRLPFLRGLRPNQPLRARGLG